MSALFRLFGAVDHLLEIDAWLSGEPIELFTIARRWFTKFRQCGPDVKEMLHDGCPVACVNDAAFGYVNVFKNHVNVGFFAGAFLDDPHKLLEGTGKNMRHVKIRPGSVLDLHALDALIASAYQDVKHRLFLTEQKSMDRTNPKVDKYLSRANKWQEELATLRDIVLACGLSEELKWGTPCYTFEGANIVLIHVFKEYCALLFFKGALLKDPKGVLVQQTKNVQAARQIRFTNVREIIKQKAIVKAYINEAIKVEKAGLKVEFRKTEAFAIPEEFQKKLAEVPELKTAFEALTPGRQRGYLLHFAAAKQSQTRISRIEKCMPKIFAGKGLNDE